MHRQFVIADPADMLALGEFVVLQTNASLSLQSATPQRTVLEALRGTLLLGLRVVR